MDPVSLVAGGIAFTQAAVAIGKGIAILRSMANASLEFCDLINEFETLRVVIESNRRVIEDIYNDAALQRYRPDLDRICLPLSQNVNQFEASAAKLLRSKDGLNKLGQKKISKRSWHTARRELYTLRDQCRKNQQELAAVMNADSLAQMQVAPISTDRTYREGRLI